jgi:signal transduction histidine kinase
MIEFLWTFEHRVTGLPPRLLLAMAMVAIAAGLFVWLGGLGYRKVMFAVVGAYCGAVCTMPASSPNLLLAAALAGAGVLLALKFQNTFLTLMTSILAAVYGFSILIRPYVDASDDLFSIIRQLTIGVPYYNWPILLALIVAPLGASAAFWQGTSAVLCSAAGTAMLLTGTILLLVRSGFAATGHISSKRELYLELFIAATVIGAIVQLLLLPKLSNRFAAVKEAAKIKAKRAKKSKSDDSEAQPAQKSTAWRTS